MEVINQASELLSTCILSTVTAAGSRHDRDVQSLKIKDTQSSFCIFMCSLWVVTLTCAQVSVCKGLQDGVHGSHVEDESQLCNAHGDEAQQEDGTEDAPHERLGCRGNEARFNKMLQISDQKDET